MILLIKKQQFLSILIEFPPTYIALCWQNKFDDYKLDGGSLQKKKEEKIEKKSRKNNISNEIQHCCQ